MTHYAVLGIAENAGYAQIRSRYLVRLLALHPDKQQQQPEDALSSSRFRRLQEAWDVLRDPLSRSSYDRDLASTRLLLAPIVAEDVLLEEMSRDCDDAKAWAFSFMYPCRCGDFFAVSLQELNELGFCEKPAKLGSCGSIESRDQSEEQGACSACLKGGDYRNQSYPLPHEHHQRSLVLACGSCSLQIQVCFSGKLLRR